MRPLRRLAVMRRASVAAILGLLLIVAGGATAALQSPGPLAALHHRHRSAGWQDGPRMAALPRGLPRPGYLRP